MSSIVTECIKPVIPADEKLYGFNVCTGDYSLYGTVQKGKLIIYFSPHKYQHESNNQGYYSSNIFQDNIHLERYIEKASMFSDNQNDDQNSGSVFLSSLQKLEEITKSKKLRVKVGVLNIA